MTLAGRSAQPAQTVILSAQHTWQQVKGCGQQVLPPKGGVAVRQPATAESYSFYPTLHKGIDGRGRMGGLICKQTGLYKNIFYVLKYHLLLQRNLFVYK